MMVAFRTGATLASLGIAFLSLSNAMPAQGGGVARDGGEERRLEISGYLQLDGRWGAGENDDGFRVRRARPILEGTIGERFRFRLMADFGEEKTSLIDAYAEAALPAGWGLRVGKFKVPLGLERLQSRTDLTLPEMGLPINLVPNRDIGLEARRTLFRSRGTMQVGVFNGLPDGASSDSDTRERQDVVARVFIRPNATGAGASDLGFGLAATVGTEEGRTARTALPSYRTAGQSVFFSYRSDGTATGTAIADGRRWRLAPQGFLYSGPFGLLTEFVVSSQEVRLGTTSAVVRNESWQVAGCWVVTGERARFDGLVPAGRAGALEVVARVSGLTVDRSAFPALADPARAARRATALGLGVNWHLLRRNRVSVAWERTRFEWGAEGGDRPTEDAYFLRTQIAF